MLEKSQIKLQGLAFGRSLQMALKTVVMYSVEHPAAERTLHQAYDCLNNLVKQVQQFTFGYLNRRVLVNNILTQDIALGQLEIEFAKRGIAAISFTAGINVRDFKRALGLLATKPSVIEARGGIKPFLEQNPIEGVRVLPARKLADEDKELGMDAESYLIAEGLMESRPAAGLRGLDLLSQCARIEKPVDFAGSAKEVLELAGKATQTALVDPETNSRELVTALAQVLEELKPEKLLALMPESKQKELAGCSARDVATDFVEDTASRWAASQLAGSAGGPEAAAAEEEVIRVLLRGIQTTRMAERLLQKVARCLQESNVPAEVYDRIHQGLIWSALSPKEKHDRLMRLERYSPQEIPHIANYLKESLNEGRVGEAIQVADHYFAFLDGAQRDVRKELARAPDLLSAMAALQTLPFMHRMAERLSIELLDGKHLDGECHREVVNCLTTTAQIGGTYEDFELVHKIGSDLNSSLARKEAEHAECCGKALGRLLTPGAVERVVELYVEKRGDPAWAKTAAALLTWLGPFGGEKVFQRLEEEPAAANRMRLIRLLSQLGPAATELARARFSDRRWYVARNACIVAGELGDPELPNQLQGTLRHADSRVQQAAVTAIIKGHAPGGARVIADALSSLHPHVLELALDELSFLKDPASVEGLGQFIFGSKGSKTMALEKAVRVLAAIPSESAGQVLGMVLFDTGQAPSVRKSALDALSHCPFSFVGPFLAEFARHAPSDPLAEECQRILGSSRG